MKLIFCEECNDVTNLASTKRSCLCEKSSGKILQDRTTAVISGPCTVIGIGNTSFLKAIALQKLEERHQKDTSKVCCTGQEFNSFVIPKWAKNIRRVDRVW